VVGVRMRFAACAVAHDNVVETGVRLGRWTPGAPNWTQWPEAGRPEVVWLISGGRSVWVCNFHQLSQTALSDTRAYASLARA
jgi:hypothetical protein